MYNIGLKANSLIFQSYASCIFAALKHSKMKRKFYLLLFTAIVCSTTNYLQAQISKGTGLLGGSINFSSNKNENYSTEYRNKNSSFSITPSYGHFIKQNLAFGGELSYGTNRTSNKSFNDPEQKQKSNAYGLGVFLRQYKNLGSSGFYLFLHSRAGVDLLRSKTEYTSGYSRTDTKGYDIRLNLSPGISYAVSPRFHIETGLNNLLYAGYSSSKSSQTSGGTTYKSKGSGFNAGASVGGGLEWTVGFRILLLK